MTQKLPHPNGTHDVEIVSVTWDAATCVLELVGGGFVTHHATRDKDDLVRAGAKPQDVEEAIKIDTQEDILATKDLQHIAARHRVNEITGNQVRLEVNGTKASAVRPRR